MVVSVDELIEMLTDMSKKELDNAYRLERNGGPIDKEIATLCKERAYAYHEVVKKIAERMK